MGKISFEIILDIESKLWIVVQSQLVTDEDQLQIWSSHSTSTNDDLHYLLVHSSILEMLNYFHSMSPKTS